RHHTRAHDAGGYRSDQWSLAAPICGRAAAGKNLLDHLPESDDDAAQDRYIPRLAAGPGGQRSATVEKIGHATPPLIGWRRRRTSLQLGFADLGAIHPWAGSRDPGANRSAATRTTLLGR